jgi:hypothetical protein
MKSLKSAKNFLLRNKWLFLGFLAITLISYFYLNKIFSIINSRCLFINMKIFHVNTVIPQESLEASVIAY